MPYMHRLYWQQSTQDSYSFDKFVAFTGLDSSIFVMLLLLSLLL